jgi:hypothetical protein
MRELRLQAGKPPVGGRLAWQAVTPQGLDAVKWRAALVRLGQSLRALLIPLSSLEGAGASCSVCMSAAQSCSRDWHALLHLQMMNACAGWR